MQVKICKQSMSATVYQDNGIELKKQDIDKEEYINLMVELSGDRIDMLREANKLFKVKAFTFKGIKR